ncbi:MucBP domain-containing protein, partial [Lachnoanaerobaculum saburreum]
GPQTVTYVYRRSDAGNVTVYHKSVYDNSDLTAPTVLDGTRKLGLPYTTSPESYADFEVSSVPANANGTFASGAQTVTYLYKRKQSGGVTVNYLDNHGNRIDNPDTITGSDNVGLPYTTTPKVIPNYDLISVPANANGTFTVAPITVDYIYKRKDAGTVTVEHIDENGNVPLDTPEVMDGSEKLGLPYTTSAKSFDNYDLVSVPTNANGTFTSTDQTVTYIYRRKDAGNVIAHYINTAGFPIESDEVLDGTRSLGLTYNTTQKDITGYSLYLVQGRETGIFTNGTIEVTYIYRKNPSVVITPVPPVTPTPTAPSPINPISPVTPITPINPVNPITPSPISPITPISPSPINPITPSPITPSRIATPSQIITPGRDQDLVIRPNRPIATPSIATSSNGSRGGSKSAGNANVRPSKAVTTNNGQSKNATDNVVPIIDKPVTDTKKPTPQKANIVPDTRRAMSVPKTADSKDVRGYFFILISSLAAAISLVLKKKEDR